MTTAALIVAAGRGTRAGGGTPKQYRAISGRPMLTRTMRAILDSDRIDAVLVCIHPDDAALYAAASVADDRVLPPATGAAERALSVRAGLEALVGSAPDKVLIHDAARPFVSQRLIAGVDDALADCDGAVAAIRVVDALRRGRNGFCDAPVPRDDVWRAQTPQGFRFAPILQAHRANADPGAADDAEIARAFGLRVRFAAGDEDNFKITTPEDFERAERRAASMTEIRTGQGYDVHALTEGDGVILCGVAIPFERRLSGHSDADVAMHALTDAVFGALAEGDIGRWFPPFEPRWKGADSSVFLDKAMERVRARGGHIVNVDVTIICERPKIAPHAETMVARLASIMRVSPDRISVKATTSERLGFTGREEGIAAMATASVALT